MKEHISERVKAALIADGWLYAIAPAGHHFEKMFPTAGEHGRAKVFLLIEPCGRWFERLDGWGAVEKDVDLREFDKAAEAIAAILER